MPYLELHGEHLCVNDFSLIYFLCKLHNSACQMFFSLNRLYARITLSQDTAEFQKKTDLMIKICCSDKSRINRTFCESVSILSYQRFNQPLSIHLSTTARIQMTEYLHIGKVYLLEKRTDTHFEILTFSFLAGQNHSILTENSLASSGRIDFWGQGR